MYIKYRKEKKMILSVSITEKHYSKKSPRVKAALSHTFVQCDLWIYIFIINM
jgi:hypothetical protein